MGLFDGMKGSALYRKGVMTHREATTLNDQGKFAAARVKYDEALAKYKESYDLGCREPFLLIATGLLEMRNGNYERAKEMFLAAEKCKLKTDERTRLRNNYAILQWKMGDIDGAIRQLRVAEQAGRTSFIYGTLGYLLIVKGDLDEAEKLGLEGLEYDDEDSVVLDNLGQVYYLKGDKGKAKEYFEKAYAQRAFQANTLYYLAKLALEEDNDTEKAKKYLDDALEVNFSAMSAVTREQVQALRDSIR